MIKGQTVRHMGKSGVLQSFYLDKVGTVDREGNGVIVPAMVGQVKLDDGSECVVPLSQLEEVANGA